MKIAITGSTGLVGSRVTELLNNDFQFLPLLSSEIDITDIQSVNDRLKNLDYDLLLHLAAYTNVDGAEKEKEFAHNVNVMGTENLFKVTSQKNKKFIYISTDFVFDGHSRPYYEDSQPNPIGYYGQTKYEGEQIVKDKAMIVRIAYPYRKEFDKKRDFMRTIRYLLEQGKELSMVTDSLITPTFVDDIAVALKHVINNFSPEIYHLVGTQSLSPYEAGKLIAYKYQLNGELIKPVTYEEYFKGKAKRPQYSEMKSKKNNFYLMSKFLSTIR